MHLDELSSDLDRFQLTLTADERARAAAYRFASDRRRFVAARGGLRYILSHYLGLTPATVPLRVTTYGKPYVAQGALQRPLQFNLAHAQAIALLAITWQRRVGIDIEQVRDLPDMLSVAGRYFAPAELQALLALPAGQQTQAFFDCWTRKEAFVKALGAGLSQPLDRFAVSLHPDEPATLLYVNGDPQASRDWQMMALQPAALYTAAMVIEGGDWHMVPYRFV